MAELLSVVDSLESRVHQLIQQLEQLQEQNALLQQELSSLEEKQQKENKAAEEWEEKYQALKMANSMLGSNTNKTEAKLKINTLIRVLDDCIAQLSV